MIGILVITHAIAFIGGWFAMPWLVDTLLKRKGKL